jgi:hypothetical protein
METQQRHGAQASAPRVSPRPAGPLITRLLWGAVTATVIVVFLVALPVARQRFLIVCDDPQTCQLTPEVIRSLSMLRLSPEQYVNTLLAINGVTALVYILLAALLFLRRADDRITLLAAFTFVAFGGMSFTSEVTQPLAATSGAWFVVVNGLDLLGQLSFMSFFCVFPDGRFVPRWTLGILGGAILLWTPTLFAPALAPYTNGALFGAPFFALLGATVVAQVQRYRRISTPRQRAQTRWVVSGYAVAILGFLALILLSNVFPSALGSDTALGQLIGAAATYGFILLIPISIVIAILRSQLWDIDTLINRALVYGSLTAILAAVYFGVVVAFQRLIAPLIENQSQSPLIIVLSTLLIAALFQPLRHRLQRAIDRRFYRQKYDAVKTVEEFAATLRQQVELEALRAHLLATVEEAMRPSHISLWLRAPEDASAKPNS